MQTIVDAEGGADDVPGRGLGVLVVGHGTRDAAGLAEFAEVVRQVAVRLEPVPVEAGFLELAEPTIAAGIERLVERGVGRLVVAPLILFAAGHAKRDIPAAVATAPAVLERKLPWEQTEPLGLDEPLRELSRLRYDEAVAGLAPVDAAQTLLVVVGRGSSDPAAVAATREFARLRAAASRVGGVETAFAAAAQPTLDDVLKALSQGAAAARWRRIVVQPHLLFAGEVRRQIHAAVARRGAASPNSASEPTGAGSVQWKATEHLGPHPLLAEALIGRLEQTALWARRHAG